jgi:hypothetical protein
MGEVKNAYSISLQNLKGRDHFEDLGVDGKKILEWILGKQGVRVLTGFNWLKTEISGGLL